MKKNFFVAGIVMVLILCTSCPANADCQDFDYLHEYCYGSNPDYSEWFNTFTTSFTITQSYTENIKIYLKNNGDFEVTFRVYAYDCDLQLQNCGKIWDNIVVSEEDATSSRGGFESHLNLETTHAAPIGQRKLKISMLVIRKSDGQELWYQDSGWRPLEIIRPTVDNDCDGFDDDGNGLIDDGTGACLVKLLFVPMCYNGSNSDFENDVDEYKTLFFDSLKMTACKEKLDVDIVPKEQVNLTCPKDLSDYNDPQCSGSTSTWYKDLKAKATTYKINLGDYNGIVYLTDQDICGVTAGTTRAEGWWAQSSDPAISMHEMAHGYGFDDEYCSVEAGGADYYCNNGEKSINYLDEELGCNPYEGEGCCNSCKESDGSPGYFSCCDGNKTPNGDRCIMTTAHGQREFCNHCINELKDPDNPKTGGNLNGNLPMACQWSNPTGPKNNFLITFSITENGGLEVSSLDTLFGRPGFGGIRDTGLYEIEIIKDGSVIYTTYFNLEADQTTGQDSNSSKAYSKGLKFVVPDDVAETDVLRVLLYRDGVLTGQTTVNGQAPIADAGFDQIVECTGSGQATVTLDASASSDTDGDTLQYVWSAPGITFTDPTGKTTTAVFPLGTTTVTLTVKDGSMEDTDTVTVEVEDTTQPILTVPADVTLFTCASPNIGTATAEDACGGTAVTITNDAPVTFLLGETTVTWTATDAEGNAITATQKVTAILGDDPSCCPAGTNIILGTAGDDDLIGTFENDCILGLDGDDLLNGKKGNDFLSGGAGLDTLVGDNGTDYLASGPERDNLNAGRGKKDICVVDPTDNVVLCEELIYYP